MPRGKRNERANGKGRRSATRIARDSQRGRRKIGYAVVGLGYISQTAVLPAFAHARSNSELRALVSGDAAKLKTLGRKYRVPHLYSYERFDQCLRNDEIDAVYIALPNSMHAAYTIAAARAGVHVLCEKPMALSVDECDQMIAACEENDVKLMIAYRLHFEEANLKAVDLLHGRKIGEPRVFNSTFTMQVKKGNIRLDRELGGGPLWDIGIYCFNAARYLFRAEPTEVMAMHARKPELSTADQRFAEVEEATAAILRFPNERLATFVCSFGAADASAYEVAGTKGVLRVDPAYELAKALKHQLTLDGREQSRTFGKRDQFAPELIYFSDCILKKREPEPSGEEGKADVAIIRALFDSAAEGRAIRLDVPAPEQRPQPRQEMRRPPVQKPDLFHSESPHP